MAKKIPIEKLSDTIKEILDEYADEVNDNLEEVTKKVVQEGAKAVRANARNTFKTHSDRPYAKSWRTKIETDRFSTVGTIYSTKPGLPHLLENGHAKRGGGRVPGRPHIAPVEQKLIEDFEHKIEVEI